jgi:hypothetical protein
MVEVEGTEAEVVAGIWVEAEEASMAVVATVEVLVATTEVTAVAVIMEAVIPVATLAEADTSGDTLAGAPLRPDRGHGKAKAQRGTLLPVGTDLQVITAQQVTPMR